MDQFLRRGVPVIFLALLALPAAAQSFRVQCPSSTLLHPLVGGLPNPNIKCQEIAGADGYATMGDGHQIYLFGFGPLSGRDDINNLGLPGTQSAAGFSADPAGSVNAAAYEPAAIMNKGVLSAEEPAPLMAIDEDDEFFLTLSNVGMIMRPDLFEQHTVHFHGYPNASSYFDGVPDASVAININGSFTYYYTAPDAGTYFWHCHITPPEHLQMGMVGQLYVRPRQNKVAFGANLRDALVAANKASPLALAAPVSSAYDGLHCLDELCTGMTPVPGVPTTAVKQTAGAMYAYNDGDGSTRYDVEYPLQLMGFDPNFHYVGMTFNPEAFADMKDKYFMIGGRGYPDTINPALISTLDSDGTSRPSQPMRSLINIPHGGRALLRISELNVTEFHTIATVGIPMTVIANNARLLRDLNGNNLYYQTNSMTFGGGESADVILDASGSDYAQCGGTTGPCTFFLYTTNLDHLSNDAENFGGMMTEIVVH